LTTFNLNAPARASPHPGYLFLYRDECVRAQTPAKKLEDYMKKKQQQFTVKKFNCLKDARARIPRKTHAK
jgi:hypothetical protein